MIPMLVFYVVIAVKYTYHTREETSYPYTQKILVQYYEWHIINGVWGRWKWNLMTYAM